MDKSSAAMEVHALLLIRSHWLHLRYSSQHVAVVVHVLKITIIIIKLKKLKAVVLSQLNKKMISNLDASNVRRTELTTLISKTKYANSAS